MSVKGWQMTPAIKWIFTKICRWFFCEWTWKPLISFTHLHFPSLLCAYTVNSVENIASCGILKQRKWPFTINILVFLPHRSNYQQLRKNPFETNKQTNFTSYQLYYIENYDHPMTDENIKNKFSWLTLIHGLNSYTLLRLMKYISILSQFYPSPKARHLYMQL